jgi:hypothetical protein
MFKLAVIALFALGCNAASYGGQLSGGLSSTGYGSALSAGPALTAFNSPGLNTYAAAPQSYGPHDAAIQTRRTVELRPVALQQDYAQPQIIEVQPDQLPVQVHFRTASSRVNVQQSHQPGLPAQVEHASFQDEPHRVVHEVVKPVIQEVREIIQPYRRVTQEIRPVIEEVHTVVHKGEGRRNIPQQPLPLKAAQGYAVNNGYKGAKAKAARA